MTHTELIKRQQEKIQHLRNALLLIKAVSSQAEIKTSLIELIERACETALEKKDLCQYEDELPADMTDAEYDAWYAKSKVVAGVRMGPKLEDKG